LILPFDKQIFVHIVKKHQVDIDKFGIDVEKQNSYLNSKEYNEILHNDIQNTYYKYLYELKYNDKKFVEEFYKLLNTKDIDIIKLVSLSTFSWYIELMTKLDNENKQEKYQKFFIEKVENYIKNNINNLINMDSFHKDGIMKIIDDNKTLKEFYEQEKQKIVKDITIDIDKIKQILNKLLIENGWGYQDEELLSSISKEQHKDWLIQDRDYFELVFNFITHINSFSGSKPFKTMYYNIIQSYKELYADSIYKNKMEFIIKRFEIDTTDK